MSAQTKLRAWVARKQSGETFTTAEVRTYLKSEGFDERQSGSLMTYMIRWWKLVERTTYGQYTRL